MARFSVRARLEVDGAEVAIYEHTVFGLEGELASLLGAELDDEEVVVALIKQEVVAAVDEGGEELLLTIRVQAVVSEVHHVLHAQEFGANIFQFAGVVGQSETESIDVV